MRSAIVVIVMILLAYTVIRNSNNNHQETLQAVDKIRVEVSNIRSDVDKALLKYISEAQLERAKRALNDRSTTQETSQKSD